MSESGSTTAAHHYTTTSLDCSSQHGLLARQDHQEPQPQLLHLHLPVSYCITHILTHSPTHSLLFINHSIFHTLTVFFSISLTHSLPLSLTPFHSFTYSLTYSPLRCAIVFGLYVCFVYGPDQDVTYDPRLRTRSNLNPNIDAPELKRTIMTKVSLGYIYPTTTLAH